VSVDAGKTVVSNFVPDEAKECRKIGISWLRIKECFAIPDCTGKRESVTGTRKTVRDEERKICKALGRLVFI
jgi:hypothetical protein